MSLIDILFQQLLAFGRMSRLVVNAIKSSIFFDGVREHIKQPILLHTGFSKGTFPFKYLGVLLSPHRLLVN